MGIALMAIGVVHFASPSFFDEIVPPWLPPGERFWTLASGVAEVLVGAALLAWTEQAVAWIRLPFQFPLIWLAVRIARDVPAPRS
ncbi:MAG: hypothetical protein EBU70_07100 [Actinobacteria bacterium]|nr:hypothetical protein [Actinomycetota bacterium]